MKMSYQQIINHYKWRPKNNYFCFPEHSVEIDGLILTIKEAIKYTPKH